MQIRQQMPANQLGLTPPADCNRPPLQFAITTQPESLYILQYNGEPLILSVYFNNTTTCAKGAKGYAMQTLDDYCICLLYTSPSPRDRQKSRMPSSA